MAAEVMMLKVSWFLEGARGGMKSDSLPKPCLHLSENSFCYHVYQLERLKRNRFMFPCLNTTQSEATDKLL